MGAGRGKTRRMSAGDGIVADHASSEEPEKLKDGVWRMWALPDGDEFTSPGHKRFAREYATSPGQVPVEVVVREQGDGPYYGWLATGDEVPSMIYGHQGLFQMCFPYGPKAEEEKGNGRVVRLAIEPLAA